MEFLIHAENFNVFMFVTNMSFEISLSKNLLNNVKCKMSKHKLHYQFRIRYYYKRLHKTAQCGTIVCQNYYTKYYMREIEEINLFRAIKSVFPCRSIPIFKQAKYV